MACSESRSRPSPPPLKPSTRRPTVRRTIDITNASRCRRGARSRTVSFDACSRRFSMPSPGEATTHSGTAADKGAASCADHRRTACRPGIAHDRISAERSSGAEVGWRSSRRQSSRGIGAGRAARCVGIAGVLHAVRRAAFGGSQGPPRSGAVLAIGTSAQSTIVQVVDAEIDLTVAVEPAGKLENAVQQPPHRDRRLVLRHAEHRVQDHEDNRRRRRERLRPMCRRTRRNSRGSLSRLSPRRL